MSGPSMRRTFKGEFLIFVKVSLLTDCLDCERGIGRDADAMIH